MNSPTDPKRIDQFRVKRSKSKSSRTEQTGFMRQFKLEGAAKKQERINYHYQKMMQEEKNRVARIERMKQILDEEEKAKLKFKPQISAKSKQIMKKMKENNEANSVWRGISQSKISPRTTEHFSNMRHKPIHERSEYEIKRKAAHIARLREQKRKKQLKEEEEAMIPCQYQKQAVFEGRGLSRPKSLLERMKEVNRPTRFSNEDLENKSFFERQEDYERKKRLNLKRLQYRSVSSQFREVRTVPKISKKTKELAVQKRGMEPISSRLHRDAEERKQRADEATQIAISELKFKPKITARPRWLEVEEKKKERRIQKEQQILIEMAEQIEQQENKAALQDYYDQLVKIENENPNLLEKRSQKGSLMVNDGSFTEKYEQEDQNDNIEEAREEVPILISQQDIMKQSQIDSKVVEKTDEPKEPDVPILKTQKKKYSSRRQRRRSMTPRNESGRIKRIGRRSVREILVQPRFKRKNTDINLKTEDISRSYHQTPQNRRSKIKKKSSQHTPAIATPDKVISPIKSITKTATKGNSRQENVEESLEKWGGLIPNYDEAVAAGQKEHDTMIESLRDLSQEKIFPSHKENDYYKNEQGYESLEVQEVQYNKKKMQFILDVLKNIN